MCRAVEQEQPDQIFHLGDHAADARALQDVFPQIPVVSVRGNCDWGDPASEMLQMEIAGKRVLLTHGHLYQVKTTPYRAILAAEEAGAELLVYGHTHQAACFQEGGVTVLNPGTCSGTNPVTYGIVTVDEHGIQGEIRTMKQEKV